MVLTKLNIINSFHGTAKQTSKQTCQDLRPSKENLAYTISNASTSRVIIKQILTTVLSGNTDSIRSGMPRNIRSFVKTKANQSAQL